MGPTECTDVILCGRESESELLDWRADVLPFTCVAVELRTVRRSELVDGINSPVYFSKFFYYFSKFPRIIIVAKI